MKTSTMMIEMFGHPIEVTRKEELRNGNLTVTHEWTPPLVEFHSNGGKVFKIGDAGFILPPDGYFISWAPPAKEKTLSDREERLMKILGWL